MKSIFPQDSNIPITGLKLLVIIILILGVFFRFANLESRAYWHDEAYTLLRVSGYTVPEVTHQSFDGSIIKAKDLKKYQSVNSEKSFVNTISGLATEDNHTPIYFLMLRFWVQYLGDSVTATRSLSALIGTLSLPCIYWLSLELFKSRMTGWIAMGLIAVSPFHVYYAQEIREYCLWTVMTLLTSILLLRAVRLQTWFAWGLYTLATIVSFYSTIPSIIVMLSHTIYVISNYRQSQKVIPLLLASVISLLAFSPWILIIITNYAKLRSFSAWLENPVPLKSLVYTWVSNIRYAFLETSFINGKLVLEKLFTFVVIALVGYSFYVLFWKTQKQVWLFILLITLPNFLSLALPDLFFGGIRSTISRYLIPSYLGIQLTVAHMLASKLSTNRMGFWKQKQWQFITSFIFSIAVISCASQTLQKPIIEEQEVANVINKSVQPLVISNEISYGGAGTFGDIMALSHLLSSKVKLQLVVEPTTPKIPNSFQDKFLYKASKSLKLEIEKKYLLKPIYKNKVWRLVALNN